MSKRGIILILITMLVCLLLFIGCRQKLGAQEQGDALLPEHHREYLTVEGTFRQATDIVSAVCIEITDDAPYTNYHFTVEEVYKGDAEETICIRHTPKHITVDVINRSYTSMSYGFKAGTTYVLALEYRDFAYEPEDRYVLLCDLILPLSEPNTASMYQQSAQKHLENRDIMETKAALETYLEQAEWGTEPEHSHEENTPSFDISYEAETEYSNKSETKTDHIALPNNVADVQNSNEDTSMGSDDTVVFFEKYNMETTQVTIYNIVGDVLADITDSTTIKTLIDTIDFDQWEAASGNNMFCAEPMYYIDFHNGMAISLDEMSAYGQLGHSFSITDASVKWEGFVGVFHMNDDFFNKILEIVANNNKYNS